MRIEKDQKRTLVIAAVMIAGFAAAVVVPQWMQTRRLRERIETAQSVMRSDQSVSRELSGLTQRINTTRASLGRSDHVVPTQSDQADLIRQLNSQVTGLQLIDSQVSTQSAVQGPDFCSIPLTVHFKGGFLATFGYIKAVESTSRLIQVDRLTIKRDAKEGGPVTADLELRTFYMPEKQGGQP